MFDVDELKKDYRKIEVELLKFKNFVGTFDAYIDYRGIILLVIHWLIMKMQ